MSTGALLCHITETGMLEEMAAEGIAGITGGLVAGGDPGAPFDQVVAGVEGGGGKIIVPGMDPEAMERIDRGLGPLPDIADHIKKIAETETDPPGRSELQCSRLMLPGACCH